jgi:hypothetical protein
MWFDIAIDAPSFFTPNGLPLSRARSASEATSPEVHRWVVLCDEQEYFTLLSFCS